MAIIAVHELPADPLDALHELARGEIELERLCRDRIASARAAGATWEQIGAALGTTKQAAREFFTRDARIAVAGNPDGDEQLGEDEVLALTVDAAAFDQVNIDIQIELGEDEALALAVEEVRAVRRRRRG